MKSGDLTIFIAIIQEVNLLRELVAEWGKEVAEGAKVQIPIYMVAVHGIHFKLIDLTRMEQAK